MRRRFMSTSIESQYMIIESLEDNLIVSIEGRSEKTNLIEYSLNGKDWNYLNFGETTPPIHEKEVILFKGTYTYDSRTLIKFVISKKCRLKGNCMAILGDDYAIKNKTLKMHNNAFYLLFADCPIESISEDFLPATTLGDYCYYSMFDNCTSLTTAPALPATSLATYCYGLMFSGCTSLTTAPELPATTLVSSCYYYMFENCKSLNYIKALFTTTPSSSYTGNWVKGVASTGTFVKNRDATWNVTGVDSIPSGWTVQTA